MVTEICVILFTGGRRGNGAKRVGRDAGPGRETVKQEINKHFSRERLTVRDHCHDEKEGARCTVATGIQLQTIVLPPTPWDTSRHQSVSGNSRVGVVHVRVCV